MICKKLPTAKLIEQITAKNLLVKTGQKLRENLAKNLRKYGYKVGNRDKIGNVILKLT